MASRIKSDFAVNLSDSKFERRMKIRNIHCDLSHSELLTTMYTARRNNQAFLVLCLVELHDERFGSPS